MKLRIKKCFLKKQQGEQGFTLLELIFAVSILAIGILAVATMQVSSIRGNAFAGNTSMATTWAADKIEKLIVLAYEDYNDFSLSDRDGDGDGGLEHATAATADHQATQGNYTIYWNVSANSLINNTKTVNVIVTWVDHGVTKNVSMRYIIPRIS